MRARFALMLSSLLLAAFVTVPHESELRLCLHSEPRTFDPLLVEDESSEAIRYLTSGVLVRLNRATQQPEPELAVSWKISENGRRIDFQLRRGVTFSDGTPFTAADVAWTLHRAMDPALHSPIGDAFRTGSGAIQTTLHGLDSITIRFPAPLAGLPAQFDTLPMLSALSASRDKAVLGPFFVADYKAGNYVLLRRNPNYWKRDEAGGPLPYLSAVRLLIQQNRDLELRHFERGDIDLIGKLDPELFDRLQAKSPAAVRDAGPSLDVVTLWFNLNSAAPLPEWKKQWFASAAFRRAISMSVNRDDLCRIVWRGHANPASGFVSPANRQWVDARLKPESYSPDEALAALKKDGFHQSGSTLYDHEGHAVEFSLVSNSGNPLHERTLAMIRQDLGKIGLTVNTVMLDFPSLIERITRSSSYEACLLPMLPELDPIDHMNTWLSSADTHPWNPREKSPATAWEAEIDRLMRVQASTSDFRQRKAAYDRVQEIAREQAPMIFLVHPNVLVAVGPRLRNAVPAIIRPQLFWNADRLQVSP
jgi:peptide/nickel transport system substrate-binding protein